MTDLTPSQVDVISPDSPEHPSLTKPWLFAPGQSGNPGGRPKKIDARAEAFRESGEVIPRIELELAKKEGREPRTRWAIMIEKLWSKVFSGDLRALELVLKYNIGKPPTKVEKEGKVHHLHELKETAADDFRSQIKRLAESRQK